MRHHNPTSTYRFFTRHKVTKPYLTNYIESYEYSGFARAKPSHRYVKVLIWIAKHPKCKRAEIIEAIWNYKPCRSSRGYMSCLFSQLLYLDLIDYDKNYRYVTTGKGLEVIARAYLNSNK